MDQNIIIILLVRNLKTEEHLIKLKKFCNNDTKIIISYYNKIIEKSNSTKLKISKGEISFSNISLLWRTLVIPH